MENENRKLKKYTTGTLIYCEVLNQNKDSK